MRYDKVVFYGGFNLQIDVVWSNASEEPWLELEWDVWILFDRTRWLQLPTPIKFNKKPTKRQMQAAVIRHVKAWSKSFLNELPKMTMHIQSHDDTWLKMHESIHKFDVASSTDKEGIVSKNNQLQEQ